MSTPQNIKMKKKSRGRRLSLKTRNSPEGFYLTKLRKEKEKGPNPSLPFLMEVEKVYTHKWQQG